MPSCNMFEFLFCCFEAFWLKALQAGSHRGAGRLNVICDIMKDRSVREVNLCEKWELGQQFTVGVIYVFRSQGWARGWLSCENSLDV